jgi:hypothetical protein
VGLAVGIYGANRVSSLNADTRSEVAGLPSTATGAYACTSLGVTECKARSDRLRSLARDAARAETIEAVGLGAGGALLLTGGGLVLWDLWRTAGGAPSPAPAGTIVMVAPAPGGALLQLSLAY